MMADATTTVADTQQAPAQDAVAGENTEKCTDLEF